MKIAILSDIHLGHAWGTERGEDPFDAMEEALEKAGNCDLILIIGDMFDSKTPGMEVFSRSMELLIRPLLKMSDTRFDSGIGKNVSSLMPLSSGGIPIVAIHGTHERRVRGLVNPIEALEKAGFLVHLHCNAVVLGKGTEKVAIHGMSGVPDQYAESVMKKWNPAPVPGAFNILMLHQSLAPFMYARHLMDVNALPRGFDLYINGHIHESRKEKYADAPFLIPGSFVTTQLTKESVQDRGFWMIDTGGIPPGMDFLPLESQRMVYYRTLPSDMKGEMVAEEIRTLLGMKHRKKPLIRINFSGKSEVSEQMIADLKARFSASAILSFRKEESGETLARTMEEQKKSVRELGHEILHRNLREFKLDGSVFGGVFELLLEEKEDEAIDLLNRGVENKA
jgi:DNA repair exonuclease SbcCD nuclease subunit